MRHIAERVAEACKNRGLPVKASELFADMYDPATNSFVVQETTHWDFKDEFPFSNSGDYFGGILRLPSIPILTCSKLEQWRS